MNMNRRAFLKTSVAATATASIAPAAWAASGAPVRSANHAKAKVAAYYLNVHMYTCVPRHVRNDMEWMAEKGTDYVCPGVLEQDLFAAHENLALIIAEAERVGMKVLAVPSRWAGCTAGAPKVPSLFSMTHPETLMRNKRGSTAIGPRVAGGISSVHHPETLKFFQDTLVDLYRQHPSIAGIIIDEPKNFLVDYSELAVAALGKNAPREAHLAAAGAFWGKVTAFAKEQWPDKLTILFQQAHNEDDELAISSAIPHLDYFGADGRPWGEADDKLMKAEEGQESGKGKILLGGRGEKFIALAKKQPGRKSFFLIENHNLQSSMIEPLDRNYPAVLALPADLFTYYYYPRNVDEPDRTMDIIGTHLKRFTRGAG
jgi:hypothetical protein